MAEQYQNEMYFDFSGGVDQSVSRLLMAANECNVIENGSIDKIGSIQKVLGYTQRGSSIRATYNVLGFINAIKPSTGVTKQIAIVDGASTSDAYTYNPTNNTWTPHGLSLTSGAKAEFESFLDGFFMVNFNDATRFNDLTAWSTTQNVTGAAKAKYIKQYLSRLYLAYVVTGGTTYPSRITYSDLPTAAPYNLTWNDNVNYFDVSPEDGDVIMGLGLNANRLLIFKENSLYRYDTNTLYQVPGCPGTSSQRSVGNIEGWTLYLHSTGIWGYDGTSSQLLSRKIKDIINGISSKNLANACHVVSGDHYYLYVGDINNFSTGLSISKCLIDYDISKQAFTWRSLKDIPTVFITGQDTTTNITYNMASLTYNNANTVYNGSQSVQAKMFFGTDDGNAFQFNVGNNINTADISFRVETKDYYLGYPAYWKLMQKVVIFNDYAGKGVIIQARADDNNWVTLGRVNHVQQQLIFPAGFLCQRIRYRFMESSGGGQFNIEGLDQYFTPCGLIQ